MGQTVSVVEKKSAIAGIVRFELNRALTGTGHERYRSAADAEGVRPPDVLARRLFARGGIRSVHVHANQVSVELEPFGSSEGLAEVIIGLYTHYTEGVTPRSF